MAGSNRVITYEDVVRAGTTLFERTATVAIDELAAELAVSRATLYRVAPGRDAILGDVLWWFGGRDHAAAVAAVPGTGLDRVVRVLRHYGDDLLRKRAFREFIAEEPDVATRVLFTPAGGVHDRFVAANAELLASSVGDSDALPFDLDTTAYVLSRIYESMWYADLLSGREPDLDVADRAARAVLRTA